MHRLATLGCAAAGVVHDLNNLLLVVLFNVGLLESRLAHDRELAAAVSEVGRASRAAGELTRRILELGRVRPEPCGDAGAALRDLRPLLERVVPAGVRFALETPPGPVAVALACGDLSRVVLNLVLNAAHATPAGGTIEVKLERAAGGAALTVSDTGTGVEPALVPSIFEPLFTTKPGGSGLGLAIVRRLVEEHGGAVAFDSEPGRGTTVVVTI
jgi:signal transduction histidine kinase